MKYKKLFLFFVLLAIPVLILLLLPIIITTKHSPILETRFKIKDITEALHYWEITYGTLPIFQTTDSLLSDKQQAKLIRMLSGDTETKIILGNMVIQNTRGVTFLNISREKIRNDGVLVNQYGNSFKIILDGNCDNELNLSKLSGLREFPEKFSGKAAVYVDGEETRRQNKGKPVVSWDL